MDEIKPLLADKKGRKARKFFNKYAFLIIAAALFLVATLGAQSTDSGVFQYVFGSQTSLKTIDGKVNVLLLGTAGGNHDGPNLTDTIMLVSYDVTTRKAALISLPRDLWVDEYKAKVNTLYQMGLNKGDGLGFAKKGVGDILGIEIPYAIRLDFNGFISAVDQVGGIEVEIERSFDDYSYPVPGKEDDLCGFKEEERDVNEEQAKALGIASGKVKVLLDPQGQIATASAKPGIGIAYTDLQVFKLFPCRFEHLSFKQGLVTMDGETALKFVRSRHGTNNEGTDFARSKRQQMVIAAFKQKVFSTETLLNPQRLIELAKTFGNSVDLDIPQGQFMEVLKLARKNEGVKSYVIDGEGKPPLLISPPTWQYGAWVLIPPNNDFTRIHQYVKDIVLGVMESSGSAKTDK